MKSIRIHLTIITIVILVALMLVGCKSTPSVEEVPSTSDTPVTEEPVRPANTARPIQPQATAIPTPIPNTPTPTPAETPAPTEESMELTEETPEVEVSPTPTVKAPAPMALPLSKVPQIIIATNALSIVPNVDPGPPFSVEISANQLLEGYLHRVSGIIRNDSAETYNGLNVIGTFFMVNGKRYGPIDVNVKCLLLAPGATCPFVIEATSKNLAEVIIHVTGKPTPRTALTPEYYGVRYTIDAIGYVHVTGTIRNLYTIPARHVTVVGSLVNAQGEIVNVNATILLDAIPAGGTAPFKIDLKYTPFRTVGITTQAEP